jgi:hypothetical protein
MRLVTYGYHHKTSPQFLKLNSHYLWYHQYCHSRLLLKYQYPHQLESLEVAG